LPNNELEFSVAGELLSLRRLGWFAVRLAYKVLTSYNHPTVFADNHRAKYCPSYTGRQLLFKLSLKPPLN
jgi:hypothetical protein